MNTRRTILGVALLAFLLLAGGAFAAPFAYITNYGDNTVSVIDTGTNLVKTTVTVGKNPFGVAVNPAGTRVYVANSGSNSVSVIDTATNTVKSGVNVGTSPYGVAVNPSGTRVYVTNLGSNSVSVLDTATNTVIATVPVLGSPYGVAVNPAGTKVYVADHAADSVTVIDTTTNTVIKHISVGGVGKYPLGVAVHPSGNVVYVTKYEDKFITVIGTATDTLSTITPNIYKTNHKGVAFSPDGAMAYVTSESEDNVTVVNTAAGFVVARVKVGISPWGVAVNPAGTRVYVANMYSPHGSELYGDVSVIDTATNTVVTTIVAGKNPVAFGQFIGPDIPKSSDATLSDLGLSSGTLIPPFDPLTTSYTSSVAFGVKSITITPTVNEMHATLTVNGVPVTSGGESGPVSLAVGDTSIPVVVTAEDGTTRTYTVTVTRENDPPVADAGGPYTADLGEGVTLDGTGSYDPNEADGDSIAAYGWDLDNDGSFDDATGANPAISAEEVRALGPGTHTIGLQVTDSFGATDTASTTLTVINHPPVASDQAVETTIDAPRAITLAATDTDGHSLTYTVVDNPSHGALSGTAPDLTYTPASGYAGTDSFTFRASDGWAGSNLAMVTITVFNTAPGENVEVQPVDSTTGTSPVTLTFDTVTEPGTATLATGSSGPAAPPGFRLAGVYYEISTTAIFSGEVTVCITYDPAAVTDPAGLKLEHYEDGENGQWVDITTSVDIPGNRICGIVTGFSPFAVFEREALTPRDLKNGAIRRLQGTTPASRDVQKDIGRATGHIQNSLDPGQWIDNSRLVFRPKTTWVNGLANRFQKQGRTVDEKEMDDDSQVEGQSLPGQKHGIMVFHQELAAVTILQAGLRNYPREIQRLEKQIAQKEARGRDASGEKAEAAARREALPVFRDVIADLVTADTVLAETAISDARNTPVADPRMTRMVTYEIQKADEEYAKAMKAAGGDKPDKAVSGFSHAWQHAQLAMAFAKMAVFKT